MHCTNARIIGEIVGEGRENIWDPSVFPAQFFCKRKSNLKNKVA